MVKILDTTCGKRSIWFDHLYVDTIYADIRPEVKPDIICDITHAPFKDKVFDLIVFDPPHLNMGEKSDMGKRYGHFTMLDIRLLIHYGFVEFHRILKDDGFVLFKWNTHDMKLESALVLIRDWFYPLFGQRVSFRLKHASQTFWVCLVKRKREEINNV